MHWVFWVILAVLLLFAAWLCAGLFIYRYACGRKPPNGLEPPPFTDESFKKKYKETVAYCEANFPEEVWMRKDDLWMHAFWFDRGFDRTVVAVHGYTGHAVDRVECVPAMTERGFNVLIPDLRAHGSSEGRWIGMGTHDSADVADWIRWLRTNAKKPQNVVLNGVSMGSATALTVSGMNDLPELKLVIADCGFTNTWEMFDSVARKVPQPIRWLALASANLWSHWLSGNDFRTPSAIRAVAVSKIPTLFIHGEADDFVPVEMGRRLYAACTAPKKLLIVPGAGHAMSFFTDPDACLAAVDEMLGKYVYPFDKEKTEV